MKKAIITGITGQDGSYLAELLLEKGYRVHGLVRRTSTFNRQRLKKIHQDYEHRLPNFSMHYGDMTDSSSLIDLVKKVEPDEIYNLAAQSHVQVSFEIPEYTAQSDALGVLRLLEVIRTYSPKSRLYQASTSELYGNIAEVPQNEKTPFHPSSPYAVAKLYAYWIIRNYREAYGLYAVNGILFNHESPRRGETFVTRKIVHQLCKIKQGKADVLYLGNLNAKRDWGYAPEYVDAMWLMLQQSVPDDYVIATGESHSVREFVEETARLLQFDIVWSGSGVEEVGSDRSSGKELVKIDPRHYRPTDVVHLCGDAKKVEKLIGWKPKVHYKELVKIMVESEMAALESDREDT
ncbi:MAG: GDP-mannose 4,6-dehydratase [Deltaproteobacteria bacterium]|nr:GDP-mannose 4,6-dehydratase [Deltaproteobacteria bacterium]